MKEQAPENGTAAAPPVCDACLRRLLREAALLALNARRAAPRSRPAGFETKG